MPCTYIATHKPYLALIPWIGKTTDTRDLWEDMVVQIQQFQEVEGKI